MANELKLVWKVHVPNLLEEIVESNTNMWIMAKPLTIFSHILQEVGQRCSEINDPILNALMCRMAIYAEADPKDENYDPQLTKETLAKVGWQ